MSEISNPYASPAAVDSATRPEDRPVWLRAVLALGAIVLSAVFSVLGLFSLFWLIVIWADGRAGASGNAARFPSFFERLAMSAVPGGLLLVSASVVAASCWFFGQQITRRSRPR